MEMPMTEPSPLQRSLGPARKRRRRWIRRGLLVAGGLAVLVALIWAWWPKPVPVEVATARHGPLEVVVDADGRTRVRDRFVVSAPAAGDLERIELEPGARVTRGDTIGRVNPPQPVILDERTRAAAEARLTAAIAQERQAQAAVARARASQAVSQRDAERSRVLFEQGAISASARERDELADQLARADVTQAQQAAATARAEVASARAALGRGVGRRATETTPIVAPADGVVLRVLRDSAGPIAAGAPLFEIGDPGRLEVVVDVLSRDAATISPGDRVRIDAWGGQGVIEGSVREVEPSAFTRVSALGIEEQRVNVIVTVDRAPPQLGDGFYVEARIVTWRGEQVLAIPASAVFRDRGRWAVYVITGGRAQLRAVELGNRGRADVEIIAGIEPGERVILHPSDRVAPDVRVAPR
jgi:HlyD family secretion protein